MRRTIFDSDHESFRDSVRLFLDREVKPNWEKYIENKQFPREMWTAFGDAGLLGLEIGEEYGGSGAGDFRYNAILAEELGALSLSLASCHSIHADIVAPYLVELTSDEQRTRWLPGFVSGEILTAIGMTEPSGGTDLAGLKTTAVADGDDWILNGSKTFITNGYSADLVIVAARTDPQAKRGHGISLFGVDAASEGFTRGRKLDKAGQDESDTAELFFEDVRVPGLNLIGELNRGFIHMMNWLPQERLSNSIGSLAQAAQILRETIDYCRERKAFGQAIGSFQYNKFLIAELVTKVEVTQSFLDQATVAHADGTLTAVDAAKVKWWTTQTQNEVLDHCVQLYGGYGYMNEYRVARAWRDGRVTKIWAGSNEIMKELIGRDLGL